MKNCKNECKNEHKFEDEDEDEGRGTKTIKYSNDVFKKQTLSSSQQPETGGQRPGSGFTLLEVMVSVAIMSIVLVSVYKLHSQSLSMNMEARFYTQAPMLAQSKLSEMETNSEDNFSNDSGEFGEDFPGYTWRVNVDDVDIEALGEISKDLKKIDITVSYNENESVYSLRTYRLVTEK